MVSKFVTIRIFIVIVLGLGLLGAVSDTYNKYQKYGPSYIKTVIIGEDTEIVEVTIIPQIFSLLTLFCIMAVLFFDVILFSRGYFPIPLNVPVVAKGKEPEDWSVDIFKEEKTIQVNINDYTLEIPFSVITRSMEAST